MHYLVAVIHKEDENIENILAPYNESDEDYFEFSPEGGIVNIPTIVKNIIKNAKENNTANSLIEEYEKALKEKSFRELVDLFLEKEGYVESYGEYGYNMNINGEFDYYVEGGRWDDYLVLKDGSRAYTAKCSEVSIKKTIEKQKELAKNDWDRSEEEGWEHGRTREEAIESADVLFYAFVIDGDWYSNGVLGEMVDRKTWAKTCQNAIKQNPEKIITIVDCHC